MRNTTGRLRFTLWVTVFCKGLHAFLIELPDMEPRKGRYKQTSFFESVMTSSGTVSRWSSCFCFEFFYY